MTTQHDTVFTRWLFVTQTAIDALRVWQSWLQAWESHHLLGSIDSALFDAVLLDMERSGLGAIINDKSTRQLREIVTGVTK